MGNIIYYIRKLKFFDTSEHFCDDDALLDEMASKLR